MSADRLEYVPLPRLGCNPNWHPKGPPPGEFLLLGLGARLDELVAAFAVEAGQEHCPGERVVGCARDHGDVPGIARVLRVVETFSGVHHARVDLLLVRRGDDLFVKQEVGGRTALRWLRVVLYGCLFVLLFSALVTAYVRFTGAHQALVQEYAKKYTAAGPDAAEAYLHGWRFDANTQAWVADRPLSVADVAKADPGLVVHNLGMQVTVIAGAVGLVLALLPAGFLNFFCWLLGWPTPREFEAHVRGASAGVRGLLCRVLFHRFGVAEAQKLALT